MDAEAFFDATRQGFPAEACYPFMQGVSKDHYYRILTFDHHEPINVLTAGA
jgi:hypothetical protein